MKQLLQHKAFVAISAVIVAGASIAGIYYGLSPSAKHYATTTATTTTVVESVTATGKVQAAQEIDLSFEHAGKITSVRGTVGDKVRAGEVLMTLDASDLQAQLVQAKASLDRETIKLAKLQDGTGSDVQTGVNNGRQNMIDKLTDSFQRTDSAVGVYVDEFFQNPKTDPDFKVSVVQNGTMYNLSADNAMTEKLDLERSAIEVQIAAWRSANADLSTDADIEVAANAGEKAMTSVQTLLEDIAGVVNNYNPTTSDAQTFFAKYKNDIATARTAINTALSNLRAARQTYNSSQATVSPYEIELQKASVDSAQGQVAGINAQIAKTYITSPINGTISSQNAKVGQIASVGTTVAGIISDSTYEIEMQVSESDVAKIHIGDAAEATLDAYSTADIFPAHVSSIDLVETSAGAAGSYRVKLQFEQADARIRSGMTANVRVITSRAENVVAVPTRAIITRGNDKVVLALSPETGTFAEIPVTIGVSGGGYTQIVSGLSAGQVIASFGNNQ